jgi:hypothetical protein
MNFEFSARAMSGLTTVEEDLFPLPFKRARSMSLGHQGAAAYNYHRLSTDSNSGLSLSPLGLAATTNSASISPGGDTSPQVNGGSPPQLTSGGASSLNNPLISDTEKCKVCGEPAARHIHYGATTCFSCRAFFRRSIQNSNTKAYNCRKGGHCVITLKSRKNCQKCRLDKCTSAGMKSSWVLSEEERFRRFRKHREKVSKRSPDRPLGEDGRTPKNEPRALGDKDRKRSRGTSEDGGNEDSSTESDPMDLTGLSDHGSMSPSATSSYGGSELVPIASGSGIASDNWSPKLAGFLAPSTTTTTATANYINTGGSFQHGSLHTENTMSNGPLTINMSMSSMPILQQQHDHPGWGAVASTSTAVDPYHQQNHPHPHQIQDEQPKTDSYSEHRGVVRDSDEDEVGVVEVKREIEIHTDNSSADERQTPPQPHGLVEISKDEVKIMSSFFSREHGVLRRL